MKAEIPEPVMEIRERFTPSEPLRLALEGLLQPPLHSDTTTRLRASFLFLSYRRRLKSQADYFTNEHQRNGQVVNATREFTQASSSRIGVTNPQLDSREHTSQGLLLFAAQQTPENDLSIRILNAILSKIDSIEQESIQATLGKHFIVPLDITMFHPDFDTKLEDLHRATSDPRQSRGFYITPERLVTRSTVLYKSQPPDAA